MFFSRRIIQLKVPILGNKYYIGKTSTFISILYYDSIIFSRETLRREQGCKYLWRGIEKWSTTLC